MKTTILKSLAKSATLIALVFIYLVNSAQLPMLHSLLHEENRAALHIDENEKDPCHRKIYHNDSKAGCSHHSHITSQIKCTVCNSVSCKEQLYLHSVDFTIVINDSDYENESIPSLLTQSLTALSARAPPVVG